MDRKGDYDFKQDNCIMSVKKATFKQRFWRKIVHVGEEQIISETVNAHVKP